jgi:transcriptional regulator with XRE-family HTH domain
MSVLEGETFGQRVRQLRTKQGIRQVDLAARAGLSWRHLIRIEQDNGGVTKPSTVAQIAGALGVETSELTGDEDDEEADPSVPIDDLLRRRVFQLVREAMSA